MELMQIGEVAARIGLSLRTIRHYDEMGLVEPSARSQGGFRLYTTDDVDRLLLIKRMKPLKFSIEEMRELLDLVDTDTADAESTAKLAAFRADVAERCERLREQLEAAEEFGQRLDRHLGARGVGGRPVAAADPRHEAPTR